MSGGGAFDPDDVADLVAHDAAVGLPGWTRVDPEPERIAREQQALAWAERVLTAAKGRSEHDRQAIQTSAVIVMTALAKAVAKHRQYASVLSLVSTAATHMVDAVHGEGTAALIDALLSWWLELTDEEKALTGVEVPS